MNSTHKSDTLRIVLPILLILLLLGAISSWKQEPVMPFFFSYRITNLQFIDGGTGVDIILATIRSEREAITIADAYVNENSTDISGTLTIPKGGTGTLLLKLPSGTLVMGREYEVRLTTAGANSFPLHASKRHIFYHMFHPDVSSPVEEGVITKIFPGYYSRYTNADCWTFDVQNTGDLAITVTGGFINGNAAINATGHLTIEKDSKEQVTLYFPAASLMDQMQNKIPFQVKLVTARDNIIAYAEPYYLPWLNDGSTPEPVVVEEQGRLTNLQFIDGGANNDLIVTTVQNTGSDSINLTSSLLNGKAHYFVPNTLAIPKGGMGIVTLPLPAGTLFDSATYQVVLITSRASAFIYTSKYSQQ